MSLQFVAGPSGCGKSYYVFKKIIESAMAKPKEKFIVIVPEQFTMQTQKDLTRMHPAHALFNIDILSFNRLAYRVFQETGVNQAPILEDMGKILVLQKIMSENKKKLNILDGMIGKSGAAARMNSQLSEFMQYNVDPKLLEEKEGEMPELLKRKLQDLRLISSEFSNYIKERYLTAEEVPVILSRVIEAYEGLKGATVILDGFTGFVPTQYMVLEKLMKMCKELIVTATTDKKAGLRRKSSKSNLFHMTHEMAEKLIFLAEKSGIEVKADIILEDIGCGRLAGKEALTFLEKSLFRYEYKTYSKDQDEIHIVECRNPDSELESVSEIIASLVRQKGYRYRDFAVVSGDIQEYGPCAERIFRENNIPCFIDRKQNLMNNPAVEFVRAAVEMAVDDMSYRSVFRFLKSGMSKLSKEEIYLMENYVLAFGIRGRKGYEKNWQRVKGNISAPDLEKLNEIRNSFLESVSDFMDGFREKNASMESRIRVLYQLITDHGIQEKCSQLEERFNIENELTKAREYAQVYRLIMDFLEKLADIMGGEKLSLELTRQLFEAGIQEMQIGIIPSGQDQVLVGDIERSRLKNIQVMFFVGLNEGIVPKPVERQGILSQADREQLSRENITLAADSREEMYKQRLYLYLNLTKPSEKLYLSYCRSSASGEALLPSYLIVSIKELFQKLNIQDEQSIKERYGLETKRGRKEALLDGFCTLGEKEAEESFLELAASSRKEEENFVDYMSQGAKEHCPDTNIDRKSAEKLFQKNMRYSASRLENYGKCAFRHFLSYALKLRERDVYEFSAADIGSVLHEAIKNFCDRFQKEGWKETEEKEIERFADDAFELAYKNSTEAKFSSSSFFDKEKLSRINRMTAKAVYEQVMRGSFRPLASEVDFVLEGIKGCIDRIDVCEGDTAAYIRIVDYKSGKRDINLNEFYYGTQLQLPLYMTAACQLAKPRFGKTMEPAGIYYYGMEDPILQVKEWNEEIPEEKKLKELRLKGISRKEQEILKLMDGKLKPGTASDVIPVKFNKSLGADGQPELEKRSRVLSREEFGCLSKYTYYLLKKKRKEIEEGKAAINPKEIDKTDSCSYCPYQSVCRFDEEIPGYKKTHCAVQNDEDVLKLMLEKLEKERENHGN